MKIKEVASNEIHWSIKRWNEGKQANDELRKRLGDTSKYFASCNIGHGYYQWNTNTIGQWLPLNNADANQQELVAQRVEEIRQEVIAKMPGESELAEQMLEVPTIDYYYFRQLPDGSVDVLVTGWGYRNFRKDPPFRIKTPQKKPSKPTTIAFAIDGVKQPNRSFTLKAPWTTKPDEKQTDDNGIFSFQEPVGTILEFVDALTGKSFSIQVSDENPEIVFDITEKTSLTVKATQDGQPVTRESVAIDYNGRRYDLPLGLDGTATLNDITIEKGATCRATLRDQEHTTELAKGAANIITFDFMSTPPDIKRCQLTIEAYSDQQPITGEQVAVQYAGQQYSLTLSDGRAVMDNLMVLNAADLCTVRMRNEQQSIYLAAEQNNTLRFDFTSTPPAPTMARIIAVDVKGQPLRGYTFRIQQANTIIDGQLDAQGSSLFIKDAFAIGQPLTAQLTSPQGQQTPPVTFTLEPQEHDYLLQPIVPKKKSPWLEILMFLLLLLILALLLIFVFRPGTNFLTNLLNQSLF